MTKSYIFRRLALSALAFALPVAMALAANTVTTVTQVTSAVTVPSGTDYHISGSTPFTSGSSVDISSTGGSVVILDAVRPTRTVNAILGAYVKIDGAKAVVGKNCDVRIHADGAIIYPYTEKDTPLKVYSEQSFGGTEVSDFGLEDNGGFMVTLTDAKLNNKIRSFKLRRGYMVTFATRAGGYGYSRCFIAADEDMEMAKLPGILDKSISSYRVFKWNDNSKKGLANNTSSVTNELLGTTSCYSFGNGEDTGRDRECVRHHIHESWPSIASIGDNSYTTSNPTVKTNNEPGNSADDSPNTVAQVLANWEALMATGKRLCSPSSHDGSLSWLRQFMDSIDARGWRCDVLDMHCYWQEGSFSGLQSWYNSYHRPIWISEWVWGASWNRNGCFSTGYTDDQAKAQNAVVLARILNNLESWDYIERYFYWNSEADRSKLVIDGNLTAAGEVYANLASNVGFKSNLVYVPSIPKSKGAPSDIVVKYNMSTMEAVITWHEPNGEYNTSMELQKMAPGGNWVTVAEIDLQETEADYTYTDTNVERGTKYRVRTVYANNAENFTKRTPEAVPESLDAGSKITINDETYYVGGNMLVNGDFEMGLYGWTNGVGEQLAAPYFEAVAKAGNNDKPFLQTYCHDGKGTAKSIVTWLDVEPNTNYYISGAVYFPNGSAFSTVTLSDGENESTAYSIPASDNWTPFGTILNTGDCSKMSFNFRWLSARAAYSGMSVQRLFKAEADAKDDAEKLAADRAAAEAEHPTFTAKAAEAAATEEARVKEMMEALPLSGKPDDYTLTDATDYIPEPNFASTGYWKATGTYTGGTQKPGDLDGTTCWVARWTELDASAGSDKTMEVSQTLSQKLSHGVYMLSVDAAADHYCLSDQHAYMKVGETTFESPKLSWAAADIESIEAEKKWETLTTGPVYVADNTTATVGFTSSKDGAVDGAYLPFGIQNGTNDKREGSYYVTNFKLQKIAAFRVTTDTALWRGICFPYALKASDDMRLFTVKGMSADSTTVYLEELESVAAGEPCVALLSDTAQFVFEEGTAVSKAKTADILRGYFDAQTAGRNTLVLKDGYWQSQTASSRSDRVALDAYTAVIKKIADIPVIDTPTAFAMSIDKKTPTGISTVTKAAGAVPEAYFDLNGRRVSKPSQPGVYVRVMGGDVRKIVVK